MTRQSPLAQLPPDSLPPVTIERIADRIALLFPDLHAPICGYGEIARAVSKGLNMSCSVLAAKRLAAVGRENRLPVWKWTVLNRVFMLPIHFQAWAVLALVPSGASVPSGANAPGRRKKPVFVTPQKRRTPVQTKALAALALGVIRAHPGAGAAEIAKELGVEIRALMLPLEALRRARPPKVAVTGRAPRSMRYTALEGKA